MDESLATCSDASGNSYVTGYFSTSASINGSSESVVGLTDIFISKTDLAGNSIWVESFGSSNSDRGLDVAVDASGNVYLCGFYKGTINFGGGISLNSEGGSQDAFVVKLDQNGESLWAKSGGSSGAGDQANGVAVDGDGNVIITGQFSGEASFGDLALNSLSNSIDVFIVKYDENGNEIWARKGSGDGVDKGVSVSTDAQNNVYAIGQFDGDIEFENAYSNTIQNAMFLIKYDTDGAEQWFRWAGGTNQSIGTGLQVDGNSIYLVGDFGESITFFGGNSTQVLNSGFDHAVFLVSYSTTGNYTWGESQGSHSSVSVSGLDVLDGEIALAGWHECTFESLSNEYGETTFNSIGYKDAYVMRYQTSGDFVWARNFGSQSDEMAHDVCLLTDGHEVIVGVFSKELVIPISDDEAVAGLDEIIHTPNSSLTYCGDADYGDFSSMSGLGNQDGFAVKVIDVDRQPYDFYYHFGAGCDLSIPETCIQLSHFPSPDECPESLIGCPGYLIYGVNSVWQGAGALLELDTIIGYEYTTTWDPSANNGLFLVQEQAEVTVTMSSADGCYVTSQTINVDVYPNPEEPLISDNAGVNDMALFPATIFLCPDETVDLTGHHGPGLTYFWTGEGLTSEQGENITVTADEEGWYTFTVVDANGCSESNFVQVQYYDTPLILEDPWFNFGFEGETFEGDTLVMCSVDTVHVVLFDPAYEEAVSSFGFDWEWSVSEPGTGILTTSNGFEIVFSENGWYTVTLELQSEENDCEDLHEYTISDSIYIEILPLPDVSISISGPSFICSGDTFMVYLDYEGELSYEFDVVADYTDSLLIAIADTLEVFASAGNEFECSVQVSAVLIVQPVSSPEIFTISESGLICPNDSILLETDALGTLDWQGPDGNFASDTSMVYVFEAGTYYLEANYYPGCELVSNTIEISEYATPFLSGSNAVLCGGDTVEISIISTGGSNVVWLDPLSGNDSIQFIFEPGIYQAEIMSCGITTTVSIEVLLNTNELIIEQADLTPVCEGDSILVQATLGYEAYEWFPQGVDSAAYFYENGTVYASSVDENDCNLESNQLNIEFEQIPPLPQFEYDLVCTGEDQIVNVLTEFNIWYLDGPEGDVIQDSGMFLIPGFTNDTTLFVYLSSEYCDGPVGTLDVGPKPFPDEPILASNAPSCTGTQLFIDILNADGNTVYHWISPQGNTSTGSQFSSQVFDESSAGEYWCFAELDDCISDTILIDISVIQTLEVALPTDTILCFESPFIVDPGAGFQDYLWHDGSSNSTYTPLESGAISVVVHDMNGCQSSDVMTIEMVDCALHIPNIFSPNGDGQNDTWDFYIEQAKFFEVVVFNRWGTQVFESTSAQVSWDGKNQSNGDDCSEGVYYFIMNTVSFDNVNYQVTGYVTIVRQ